MKYLRSKQLMASSELEPCYEKVADSDDDDDEEEKDDVDGAGSASPSAMSFASSVSSKGW